MQQFFYFLILLTAIPAISFASYNDATLTTDAIISVGSYNLNVHGSSSVIQSIVVNTSSFDVTLLSSSSFSISSATRAGFNVSGSITSNIDCSTPSVLTLTPGSGTSTVTVTPVATCTGTPSNSSGSRRIIPPVPPLNTTPPTDCLSTYLFSPSTGKPCPMSNQPVQHSVLNIPHCSIKNTLGTGWYGPEVKCLQESLNLSESFRLSTDGIFGPMTKAAVILFQKAHNLTPDGIVGPKTRVALSAGY